MRILAGATLRPDARGRLRLKVSAAAAASGTLRIVDAKGRPLSTTAKVRLRRAGTATTVVTLSRKARTAARRGTLHGRAIVTLRAATGRVSTASAAVKIRGR